MDKGTLIRTVVLFIALLNQTLVMFGYSPLPIEDEQIENFISLLFTIAASLWAWWKNNYISKKGKRQYEVLKKENLAK